MYNLTIMAATPEDLRLQLLGLLGQFNGITLNSKKEVENPPLVEVPKEEAPVAAEPAIEEAPAVEEAPAAKETPKPKIEDVRAALKELRDRKGSGAVRELLKAFGADSLLSLKEEDYLGALARAKTEV